MGRLGAPEPEEVPREPTLDLAGSDARSYGYQFELERELQLGLGSPVVGPGVQGGGAFEGLSEIVARRVGKAAIGFRREVQEVPRERLYELATPEDLVQYGMIPEFIGRVPVIVTLSPLSEEDLVEVLIKPRNAVVKQFQKIFQMEGVKLTVTPAALRAIARQAIRRGTGARGLRAILEEVLLDTMFKLPSLKGVSEVIVDEDLVPRLVFADRRKASRNE